MRLLSSILAATGSWRNAIRLLPLLAAVPVGAQPSVPADVPQRADASISDAVDRRADGLPKDSTFRVMAFPLRSKVFNVSFNDGDLSAGTITPKYLIVKEDPTN